MSKTYPKSFEAYQLHTAKPMQIEQDSYDPAIFTQYARHYRDNPIYYQNCFQYLGGGLYRRILGYETLWDKEVEDKLTKSLDFILTEYEHRGVYYTEELIVNEDTALHGIKWHRSIAPKSLNFNLQWSYQLRKGERLTARVNLIDKPNHVDIERDNGEVFTIQFMRYQNYRSGRFKRKDGKSGPRRIQTTAISLKNSKTKGISLVKRNRPKDAVRALSK